MAPSFLLVLFLSVFAASSFAQTVNPNNTIAYGSGLNLALAGQVAIFYVQPVDTNGKNITICQLPFGAVLFNNSAQPIALRNDCTAGLIAYHYQARLAIVYTLQITYQGQVISKGTFHPVVIPGPVYAPGSVVSGPGLNSHSVGLLSSLNITQWDAYGNRNYSCNIDGSWLATLSGASSMNMTFQSCSQGVWTGRYLATVSGPYDLRISLNGQNAQGSPFHLTLSAGALDAKLMYASGPGASNATAGILTVFYIITKDQYGNFITSCGGMDASDFNVYFTGGNSRVNATIVSCSAGVWTINYNITTAIRWQLWLYYRNTKSDSSPTYVYVFPSSIIDGERSQASGIGLTLATAGVPAPFNIIPFDIYGNQITTCSKDTNYTVWGVTVNNGSVSCTAGVAGCTNGNYNGQFSCYKSQYYSLSINYKGETIKGSPFKPFVQPGAINGPTSIAKGDGLYNAYAGYPAVFEIDAYDQYNNKIHKCPVPLNPTFQIIVQATDIGVTVNGNITACNDGNFTGQYIITRLSFLYTVSINYGGNAVDESPYSIQTYPGPPNLKNCVATGQGLNSTIAGQNGDFTLKCQDQFGNWVSQCYNSSYWNSTLSGPAFLNAYYQSCDASSGIALTAFRYVATRAGQYNLVIRFTLTVPILQYNPVVYPGPFSPQNSVAVGQGVESQTIPTGTTTYFYILSQDQYGNNVSSCATKLSDFNITIQVIGPGNYLPSKIQTCSNGRIPVTYMSTQAGKLRININYQGRPIRKSPYYPAFVAGPPGRCHATGPGLISATAGQIAYFQTSCSDKFGNPILTCYPFSVWKATLSGPSTFLANFTACSNSSGFYTVSYTATVSGNYTAAITNQYAIVGGSPWYPFVYPGPLSETQSLASGSAYTGGFVLVAGTTTTVSITSYDAYRNRINTCTVNNNYWTVLSNGTNHTSSTQTNSCSNGVYTATFTLIYVDVYKVFSLGQRGGGVRNNPGSITVTPAGLSGANSRFTAQQWIIAGQIDLIHITAYDRYGNRINTCPSNISYANFTVIASNGTHYYTGSITNCVGQGDIRGTIQVNLTGIFPLSISYYSNSLTPSPLPLYVSMGNVSLQYTRARGPGVDPTTAIVAGAGTTFYIDLYNQYGIRITDNSFCQPWRNWTVWFNPTISAYPSAQNATFGKCSFGSIPVYYNATWANHYNIYVYSNKQLIGGNPYRSWVIPTYLDPTKTLVYGLNQTFITYGNFSIIARDIFGNSVVNTSSSVFHVSIDPACVQTNVVCQPYNDVLLCKFWVWEGGRYCISVFYNTLPVYIENNQVLVYGGLACKQNCQHGYCFATTTNSTSYVCNCFQGYTGSDCSRVKTENTLPKLSKPKIENVKPVVKLNSAAVTKVAEHVIERPAVEQLSKMIAGNIPTAAAGLLMVLSPIIGFLGHYILDKLSSQSKLKTAA